MREIVRFGLGLFTFLMLFGMAAGTGAVRAYAQDFYGEGNVLIAVDMGDYAENEGVYYPEKTMGTLVWGSDAPVGKSSRAPFNAHPAGGRNTAELKTAEEYEPQTAYYAGQKIYLPFNTDMYKYADTDAPMCWLSTDRFPQELVRDGSCVFQYSEEYIKTENGVTSYYIEYEEDENGEKYPLYDFVELECVCVSEYCTLWRYTGVTYSNRPVFNIGIYGEAVDLSDEQIECFADLCNRAYLAQKESVGDPLFEDLHGDRDKKAAFVFIGHEYFNSDKRAFYDEDFSIQFGFDCVVIGTVVLSKTDETYTREMIIRNFSLDLFHEINHYITAGCVGVDRYHHREDPISNWLEEAFAQYMGIVSEPDCRAFLQEEYLTPVLCNYCSRIRMIPGFVWGKNYIKNYPLYTSSGYALGPVFMVYLERELYGTMDGRLLTEFLWGGTQDPSMLASEFDCFLLRETGEGLEAWTARFMAAVVVDAEQGLFSSGIRSICKNSGIDRNIFFRPYGEYGEKLGNFDGASDEAIKDFWPQLSAVRGGGTTYAYRNDEGGRIAITGAGDNWYFFAINMELPDPDDVIGISDARELDMIGRDEKYPCSGKYRLTADIDLSKEFDAWIPIGGSFNPFTGEFDGDGHTISGLYISNKNAINQGLFGEISGNAVIENLTVQGYVKGKESIGGIVGFCRYGTFRNCESRVTLEGDKAVGGIAGSTVKSYITDCNYTGSLNGKIFTGGITGICKEVTLQNCTGQAYVSGMLDTGGIAGNSADSSCFTGCVFKGKVSGNDYTGGIAGLCIRSTIQNCTNEASVSGTTNTGGIGGCAEKSDVNGCISSGKVSGSIDTGGIVGFDNWADLSDCMSMGNVTGFENTGGLSGTGVTGRITGCGFGGIVSGELCTGGISGYYHGYGLISDCRVTGTVSGKKKTGSLMGEMINADLVNCGGNQSGIPINGSISGECYYLDADGYAKLLVKDTDQEELVIDAARINKEPRPITVIGKKALSGNRDLKSVIIGESVKVIGKKAFKNDKNLTLVEMTSSVKRISRDAFKGIDPDAVFKIKASEADFNRIVGLIKASGVSESVTFMRIDRGQSYEL